MMQKFIGYMREVCTIFRFNVVIFNVAAVRHQVRALKFPVYRGLRRVREILISHRCRRQSSSTLLRVFLFFPPSDSQSHMS